MFEKGLKFYNSVKNNMDWTILQIWRIHSKIFKLDFWLFKSLCKSFFLDILNTFEIGKKETWNFLVKQFENIYV